MKNKFLLIFIFLFISCLFFYSQETKSEESHSTVNEDYNIAFEFSAGLGGSFDFCVKRTNYVLAFDEAYEDDYDTTYSTYFNLNDVNLEIPFSFLWYIKEKKVSAGFSFTYTLCLLNYSRLVDCDDYEKDNSSGDFCSEHMFNLSMKIIKGDYFKHARFFAELGVNFRFYYNYYRYDISDSNYSDYDYSHYHEYNINFGPRLALGANIVYNNFSFETGSFIACFVGSLFYYRKEGEIYDISIKHDEAQQYTDTIQFNFGFFVRLNFHFYKPLTGQFLESRGI